MATTTFLNSVLKMIFFVHLVFTSWGLQSDWAPTSYFFYNLLFLLVLLWGLHQQDSDQPIAMAFYFDIVCCVLDIVNVGVFFPSRSASTSRRFSAGMAIVNMLLRPFTAFFLYKLLQERYALYGEITFQDTRLASIFSKPVVSRANYQDIDGSRPSGAPETQPASTQPTPEARTVQQRV